MKQKEAPEYRYKKSTQFEILSRWTAGMVLEGWEVSSLKNNNGDINGSYCQFRGSELCLVYCKISPMLTHANIGANELRERKLLLNKSESKKIREELSVKGLTCIPLKLYRNKSNIWKIDIAIVKPLKKWDKREKIKQKDLDRQSKLNKDA